MRIKMKDFSGPTLLLIMALVVAPAVAAQQAQPPVVLIQEAQLSSFRPMFEHPARIEAVQTASIRPIVSGQVTAVHFHAGDIVKKGQLLVELDETEFQIAIAEAEANLKQAEANAVKSDADLERAIQLLERQTISQRDLDFARATAEVARAQVQIARARLDLARKDLAETKVEAPFGGRVGAPEYAVGDLFSPGDPTQAPEIATLVALDPIYATGLVDQANYFNFLARRLRLEEAGHSIPPLEISVILPGGAIYPAPGRFENWDNTAAPSTGTIAARVLFPNPEGVLLPGQNITIRGQIVEAVETVLIPQRAVSYDQVSHYVWVVDEDGAATRRNIEVGIRHEGQWSVPVGLDPGDQVIIEGLQKVRDGLPVTVEIWQG